MGHAAAVGFEVLAGFGRAVAAECAGVFERVGAFEVVDGFERDGGSWRRAHEELVAIAGKRAGLDFQEGRWLLRACRAGVHRELGYGSFNEYVERLFGYSARVTQEKLRVAEALQGLPQMASELEDARISFSAVRELTRVAVPSTEREWIDAARGYTVREVEALVSGLRPGSRPGDVPDASVKRHVLRLEVSGETLATFREAMAEIRRGAGEAMDDDSAILQLCRGVLAGSREEGRSSYQVALTVCERCGAGTQQGRGELVAVAREVIEMAECDAQHVGHVDWSSEAEATHVGRADGETRAAQLEWDVEPSDNADGAHVGEAVGATRIRATQTVLPALRRQVLRRDAGCCQVPGCRHATFVDVHHVRLRSEGGANTLENLVTLCGAHHRAIHTGTLLCAGSSQGLTFRHADGTPYGGSPVADRAEARAKAYRALVQLGFRELEVKQALSKIAANSTQGAGGAAEVVTVETLVRAALRDLPLSRR